MQLSLIAVGRRMPSWVQQGVEEYSRRLPRQWQFQVRELAQANADNASLTMAKEADAICAALPEKGHVVVLDNLGKPWSTSDVAKQLQYWQELGKPVSLVVGGANGLDPRCRDIADQQWSLSALTFPHPMVRIIVTEQLYRAHSLLINHPYHRA